MLDVAREVVVGFISEFVFRPEVLGGVLVLAFEALVEAAAVPLSYRVVDQEALRLVVAGLVLVLSVRGFLERGLAWLLGEDDVKTLLALADLLKGPT